MTVLAYDPLDEALDRLSGCGPELANGNFNHAPMVAEALCALGRPDAVMPWIERYQPRMLPPPEAIGRVAVVPSEQRRPGNITAALTRLDDFPEFAPAIGLADLDGTTDRRLAELTELFARVFLANAHNGLTAIVFIHGVTRL